MNYNKKPVGTSNRLLLASFSKIVAVTLNEPKLSTKPQPFVLGCNPMVINSYAGEVEQAKIADEELF